MSKYIFLFFFFFLASCEKQYILKLLPVSDIILEVEKEAFKVLINSNSPFITKVLEKRDDSEQHLPYLHSLVWRDIKNKIDKIEFTPILKEESKNQLVEGKIISYYEFHIFVVSNKKNDEQMEYKNGASEIKPYTDFHLTIEPNGFDIFMVMKIIIIVIVLLNLFQLMKNKLVQQLKKK